MFFLSSSVSPLLSVSGSRQGLASSTHLQAVSNHLLTCTHSAITLEYIDRLFRSVVASSLQTLCGNVLGPGLVPDLYVLLPWCVLGS